METPKWEYKLVNLMTSREATTAENIRALQLMEKLNKDGQENWELISQIQHGVDILPEGFAVLKRLYQAPKVTPRRFGDPRPKVVVPAVAKPQAVVPAVVAAVLTK